MAEKISGLLYLCNPLANKACKKKYLLLVCLEEQS